MKRTLKYTATILVLLLLGYTQVFAHIHRDDFSSVIKAKSHHLQAPVPKSSEIGSDYYEEETKRDLLKTSSRDNTGSKIFYAHVSAEYFFRHLEKITFFGACFSHLTTFRASLFRVLRL